ncbi:DNA gyrase inhibitor YacG [Uliginosibacterium flavum]|uniref:DNA gyrase inhibitor YacG n=1 Tax=Uliginosibacterium flavum TaxID=1396831 RepID=A0ABV2TGK6_9RHOO
MTQAKTPAPRIVACPTCAKSVPWTPESRYRPFCSDRCRLIDIGAWAAESYRVAGQDGSLPDVDPTQD